MLKRERSRQLEEKLNTLQQAGPAAWAGLPEDELFTPAGFSEQQAEATASSNYSYWGSTFRAFFKNKIAVALLVALAAVVLYNLISVNLAERKKELATIKVLGFYDKEVYRYIFREIELLSLIGSGVGLLLGVPLHRFIILTVEMDQLMFIRTIAPRSYLLAVALTMLFTVVVCFAMRRHVRHISMVESMKAPE